MEERRRENLACLGFALLGLFTLWPSVYALLPGLADEGTVATNGARLLYGELPYRDYFLRLPPLTDWTVGLWFKLFGENLFVLRAYYLFGGFLSTILLTKLSFRYLTSARLLPPLWFVLISLPAWPMASFAWDAGMWSLLAIYCLDNAKGPKTLFAAGFLIALTGMALHTKGASLWLAVLIALWSVSHAKRLRWYSYTNLGVLVPSLAFLGFLASYGAVGLFFEQAIFFNTGAYLQAQGHSLDLSPVFHDFNSIVKGLAAAGEISVDWIVWFIEALAYFVITDLVGLALYYPVVVLGAIYFLWRGDRPVAVRVLILTLLFASLLDLGRPNRYHLNFHLALYSYLVAMVVDLIRYERLRRAIVTLLAVLIVVVGWTNYKSWSSYRYPVSLPRGYVYTQTPHRARLYYDLLEITESQQEEYMFAFPDASLTAWLLGKRNPTGLSAALPLFYTDTMFQEAKVRIDKHRCRWLLYIPISQVSADEYGFDPEEFQQEQVDILNRFTQGYQPVKSWGAIVLYERTSGRAGLPTKQPESGRSETTTVPTPVIELDPSETPSRKVVPAPR